MDVASLAKLFAAEGPFVSIYLDATSAVENAAARLELRWKNVLRELEEAGVDEPTRSALTEALGSHGNGNTRVLVAAQGRVQLATWLPEPPPQDVVRVGPLPHLLPLIDSLSLRIPHVVVLADRTGGDVLAYTVGPDPVEAVTVDSQAYPVHQTGVGGWSSKRYDNTVHNSWEESAKDVATLVDNVCRDIGADLVIASGDERALALLEEHLPAALREGFTKIEGGGRHLDGSDGVVADQVVAALAQHAAQRTLQTLNRFAELRGRGADACEGVDATLQSLRMAQVDTLLLTDQADRERNAWFGPEAVHAAATRSELTDLGVDAPQEAPLVDVLLRAALGTGAEVRLVAGDVAESPAGGVGALLRFTNAPGTRS